MALSQAGCVKFFVWLVFILFFIRRALFATFCFTHARENFNLKGDLFHRTECVEKGLEWKCCEPVWAVKQSKHCFQFPGTKFTEYCQCYVYVNWKKSLVKFMLSYGGSLMSLVYWTLHILLKYYTTLCCDKVLVICNILFDICFFPYRHICFTEVRALQLILFFHLLIS